MCRSVPRWQRAEAVQGDRRQSGQQRQVCPPDKLSETERVAVMAALNSGAFKDLPPQSDRAAPGR